MLEKFQTTEFFLVRIFLYSDWMQENTDLGKLRFWRFSRSDIFTLQVSPDGIAARWILKDRLIYVKRFFMILQSKYIIT